MRSVAIAVLLCALSPIATARAETSLLAGLGGPAGYGGNSVTRGDAENVEVIFGTAFPSGISLFGTTHSSVWINTDGNVSFGGPQSYRPDAFPGAARPMIAAWWSDVDTSAGEQAGDPAGANTVYWQLDTGRLTVTWYLVGYYSARTDQRVSVQLVLRQRPGAAAGVVDIDLRYNRCEWIQGMRADSVPAQAGFDLGDDTRYLALPYSREFDVVGHICRGMSNTGTEGYWTFLSDMLPAPVCGNTMRETGEQCDDGGMVGPPCRDDDCQYYDVPPFDAAWLPEGGRPDASFPFPDGAFPGADGGGSGSGDGGGGSGMDGGGGRRDGGGGGSGGDGIDVFGGGCRVADGRAGGADLLAVLAVIAALASRRSRPRRPPARAGSRARGHSPGS